MTGERDPGETPALKAEIEGLRAQLALMREHADELRHQRDSWQHQAESAQRILLVSICVGSISDPPAGVVFSSCRVRPRSGAFREEIIDASPL